MIKVLALVSVSSSLILGLVGCNAGNVSEDQQQAKVKAMDDIAKRDPNFARKHNRGDRG